MDVQDMLPLNPRDFLILFVLSDGERHGYGVVKEVEERSGGRVTLDPATLYRSIRKLMRDGLVTETDGADEDGGERRRYYGVTPFGRRVVAAEASRLADLTDEARAKRLIPDGGAR
jgi:DNA-binding PadR family transcriptional regulator